MKQQTIGKAVIGFLGMAVLVSLGASNLQDHESEGDGHSESKEEHAEGESDAGHGDEHPAREYAPHERAPRNLSLEVNVEGGGDWLRSQGEEWFKANPDRFSNEYEPFDGNPTYWDVHKNEMYNLRLDPLEGESAWYLWVPNSRLTQGRRDFIQYCASCHGFEGDGYGRSAQGLRPPPRDFTTGSGNFKFTKILANLPSDIALRDLIKKGLDGTPMLKWDLSDIQLDDIIQYIKFLSPPERDWRDVFAEIGDKVDMGDDPWEDNPKRGIDRGMLVYHGSKANCWSCHPSYVSRGEISEMQNLPESYSFRANVTYPVLSDSSYEVLGHKISFLPPDFTWHQVRSGTTVRDLAETIAAGIKGTAMPQWKGALTDENIWAIAYYVENLISEYKDQPSKRAAFFAPLRAE
jgi:mono/diheme cytochrome c family protein